MVIWDTQVAGTLNVNVAGLAPHWNILVRAVRVVGLLMISAPWSLHIRRGTWPIEYQIAALTGLFAVVYALFPGVTDGWTTVFSDPLVWIALFVTLLVARRSGPA
jgi:hypothetical protein